MCVLVRVWLVLRAESARLPFLIYRRGVLGAGCCRAGKWTSSAAKDYGSKDSGEEIGAVTPMANLRKVKGIMDGTSLSTLCFYTFAAFLMVFGVMAAQGMVLRPLLASSICAPRTRG